MKKKKEKTKKVKKTRKSNLSIKAKLLIFSLFLSVVPILIVGGYSYTSFKSTIKNEVGILSEQLTVQNTALLDTKLNEIERASIMAITNLDLRKILAKEIYDDSYEELQDTQKIKDALMNIMLTNQDIKSITLYKDDERIYGRGNSSEIEKLVKTDGFKKSDIYNKILSSKGQVHWVPGLLGDYNQIFIMRKVTDYYNTSSSVLISEVDSKAIHTLYGSLKMGSESNIMIGDIDNNLIYQYADIQAKDGENQQEVLDSRDLFVSYTEHIDSEKEAGSFISGGNLVSYSTSYNGWRLISTIPLRHLMGDVDTVGTITLILAMLCIVVSVVLSIYITLSITKPLNKIMGLMNKVEEGDLTVQSDLEGKNEIGKLSIGFNQMVKNMRELIKDTTETFRSVKTGTKTVDDIAEQYTMVSEQVAVSMGEIANGSTEQARHAEDTTNIMSQLSSSIDNMAKSMVVVKGATDKTKEISSSATETIKTLYDKTEEYAKISGDTKESIAKLESSVSEIINIVELIKSISEQTNLLALNAAIEAARSGEAGKGFAVVADEIRKLAEESKEATNKITDLANDINTDVASTVESVGKGEKIFGEQYYAVFDTETAFKNILSSIEEITSEVIEVTDAVDDIEQYKNKTIDAVESIAAVTEEAAAGTQEVMASTQQQSSSSQQLRDISKELITLVERLNHSIDKFKVDGEI